MPNGHRKGAHEICEIKDMSGRCDTMLQRLFHEHQNNGGLFFLFSILDVIHVESFLPCMRKSGTVDVAANNDSGQSLERNKLCERGRVVYSPLCSFF